MRSIGAVTFPEFELLDGHKASTNKAAFHWVTSQGPNVDWQAKTRWTRSMISLTAAPRRLAWGYRSMTNALRSRLIGRL